MRDGIVCFFFSFLSFKQFSEESEERRATKQKEQGKSLHQLDLNRRTININNAKSVHVIACTQDCCCKK